MVCFSAHRVESKNDAIGIISPPLFAQTPFIKKIIIAQRVNTVVTRINYRIVPVTILNKYLRYGTSGTE